MTNPKLLSRFLFIVSFLFTISKQIEWKMKEANLNEFTSQHLIKKSEKEINEQNPNSTIYLLDIFKRESQIGDSFLLYFCIQDQQSFSVQYIKISFGMALDLEYGPYYELASYNLASKTSEIIIHDYFYTCIAKEIIHYSMKLFIDFDYISKIHEYDKSYYYIAAVLKDRKVVHFIGKRKYETKVCEIIAQLKDKEEFDKTYL